MIRDTHFNPSLSFWRNSNLHVVMLSRDPPSTVRNKGDNSEGSGYRHLFIFWLRYVEMLAARGLSSNCPSATWFVVVFPTRKALDSRYVGCYLPRGLLLFSPRVRHSTLGVSGATSSPPRFLVMFTRNLKTNSVKLSAPRCVLG